MGKRLFNAGELRVHVLLLGHQGALLLCHLDVLVRTRHLSQRKFQCLRSLCRCLLRRLSGLSLPSRRHDCQFCL